MTRRLDAELAVRGLARSRTHAAALVDEGLVRVDGTAVRKPSLRVPHDAVLTVVRTDGYVGRGAYKLLAALDAFSISVAGRAALDMGASTGGFTQVLRERGAEPVVAVDVGHGQLAAEVASDPGVIAVEGFNVRYMTAATLAAASGIHERPSLVTGDLSFISLRHVVPAVAEVVARDADVVLLVKPQFEVGRGAIGAGVVTDPFARAEAVGSVISAAEAVGLIAQGLVSSPITGTRGNREYLLHLREGGKPQEWTDTVRDVTGER